MTKDETQRIRVTLNLDAWIYGLAKRMSKVEERPISRIVDEALFPIVEKFSFATPEAWKAECANRATEEMENGYEPPEVDDNDDTEMDALMKKLHTASSNEEKLLILEELKELTELRKSQDEYRNRWIKYCSE